MLRNQPLAHGEYQPETTSVVTWLMCAIAGALAVPFLAEAAGLSLGTELSTGLGLPGNSLSTGKLWPFLTFWLLHSTTNLFHVGIVLIGLFLLGRELIPQWGSRRFLAAFALSLGLSGLTWCATRWDTAGTLIGSTAGLYGLVTLFALLRPEREFRVLVFFLFPVSVRSRQLAFALVSADLLALLLIDIFRHPIPFDYAPSAHLGGMLAGWICFKIFTHMDASRAPFDRSKPFEAKWPPDSRAASPPIAGDASTSPAGQAEVRRQLDHILDKINREGMSALTPEERRLLDNAKELLNRR